MGRRGWAPWIAPTTAALLLAAPPALHLLLEVWWAPATLPLLCAAWISIDAGRSEPRDRGSGLVLFVMCATLWFLAVPLFVARRKHA
mgnify:FL=1